MNRIMIVTSICAIAFSGAAIFLIFKVNRFVEIDRCLDKGNMWNYKFNRCQSIP